MLVSPGVTRCLPWLGLCLLSAFLSGLILRGPARACSLVPQSSVGASSPISGPRPLFASDSGRALQVLDPLGQPVVLEEVDPPAGLGGVTGPNERPIIWLRPRDPLAPGEYDLGWRGRLVVRTASSAPPAIRSFSEPIVSGPAEEDEEGCFMEEDSCGPISTVELALEAEGPDEGPPRYLLTLTGEDGETSRWLVQDPFRPSGLRFYGLDPGYDMLEEVVCARAAVVSAEGAVGPAVEVGCTRPPGSADGCTSAPFGRKIPTLFALALGLALFRLRARAERRGRESRP